jgi:Fe-S cluster assembly scaffold protein SufB
MEKAKIGDRKEGCLGRSQYSSKAFRAVRRSKMTSGWERSERLGGLLENNIYYFEKSLDTSLR